MNSRRTLPFLCLAVVVSVPLALLSTGRWGRFNLANGWVIALGLAGSAQIFAGAMLSFALLRPGQWWACSSVGQVLLGSAWLLWAGYLAVQPDGADRAVPALAFLTGFVLFVLGSLAETRARVRHRSAR